MTLQKEIGDMKVSDLFETSPILTGRTQIETLTSSITNPPIGAIIAWLKSFTNTPSLPDGWVECDGSVLSDGNSVYDGETIPDLNGDNRFLRGEATSGGTGGSETHVHTVADLGQGTEGGATGRLIGAGAGTGTTSTLPTHYEVVWIMRIK
jgi:hypothetical protein